MNKFIGIGRLTDDITLNLTQSGKSVTSFTIAINRKYDKEKTDFIDCVAWGGTAEFMERYLGKGLLIAVEGELQKRSYTDKEGNNRWVSEIVVSNVQAIEWKRDEPQQEQQQFEPKNEYQPNQDNDLVLDITSDDLPF